MNKEKIVDICNKINIIGIYLFALSLTMKIAPQNIIAYTFLLVTFTVKHIISRKKIFVPKHLKFFYIVYLIGLIISNIFAIDSVTSWKGIHTSIKLILFIPLINIIIENKIKIHHLLILFVTGIFIENILTVLKYNDSVTSLRASGWHGHPVTYSEILLFAFFYIFFTLIYYEKKILKILFSIALILNVVAIGLAQTRSVWISMVFSVILFFIYLIEQKKTYYILILLVIISLMFPLLSKSENIQYKLSTLKRLNISNINDEEVFGQRALFWKVATKIISNHWLTGVGIYNTETAFNDYTPKKAVIYGHVHNTYLQVLIEFGIFGFIAIMYLLFSSIIVLLANYYNGGNVLLYILSCLIISFCIVAITEYNWGDSEVIMNLIFAISIGYGLINSKNILSESLNK